MERFNEFKRFCNIYHLCANYTKSFAGDILIDLPRAWEKYEAGDWPVLTVRKTGADLLDRFTGALLECGKPCGFAESIQKAQSSLGVDFLLIVKPDEVIVCNIKTGDYEWRDLLSRLEFVAPKSTITVDEQFRIQG